MICEDFDEALSKVQKMGSLHEYQQEFEQLGNRMWGWMQKALVGTFVGGLKLDIANDIHMFKPKTLKDAISLARMRDEQLIRQRKALQMISWFPLDSGPTIKAKPTIVMKSLSWEEMQKHWA